MANILGGDYYSNLSSNKKKIKNIRTISHKIVIIGDANVGKTCLINRFNHNKFQESSPTIGAIHHSKTVENVNLDIWDTAGQERFKSMIPLYYKGAKAIIICFDITNKDSYLGAQNWFNEIIDSVKKVVFVLCGTKKDLENNREIPFSVAKKFADLKGIKYMETSSKDDLNIYDIFKYIAEQITLNILKKEFESADLKQENSNNKKTKILVKNKDYINNINEKKCC